MYKLFTHFASRLRLVFVCGSLAFGLATALPGGLSAGETCWPYYLPDCSMAPGCNQRCIDVNCQFGGECDTITDSCICFE